MGYDFATMVHDFKLFVRFFTFFDVSLISIDCPARCTMHDAILYKKKMSPCSLSKLFDVGR